MLVIGGLTAERVPVVDEEMLIISGSFLVAP